MGLTPGVVCVDSHEQLGEGNRLLISCALRVGETPLLEAEPGRHHDIGVKRRLGLIGLGVEVVGLCLKAVVGRLSSKLTLGGLTEVAKRVGRGGSGGWWGCGWWWGCLRGDRTPGIHLLRGCTGKVPVVEVGRNGHIAKPHALTAWRLLMIRDKKNQFWDQR